MSFETDPFNKPKSPAEVIEERIEQGLPAESPEPAQKSEEISQIQEEGSRKDFEDQVNKRKKENEIKIQEIRKGLGLGKVEEFNQENKTENVSGEPSQEERERFIDEVSEAALKNAENVLTELGNQNLSVKREKNGLTFSYDAEGYYGPPLYRRGPAQHFELGIGSIAKTDLLRRDYANHMREILDDISSSRYSQYLKDGVRSWLDDLEKSGKIRG